ncbi:hypothetical protein G6F31_019730 [Rhizopus arrhizus]|nr:hypothetical protein G6F31_019730 [Rhizopus arrhizus]
MRHRLLDQCVAGDVVQHIALVIDDAVLAMRGVRVQRHVGHHPQFRETRLQRADRPLRQAVLGPRRRRVQRLQRRVDHREQVDHRNAQFQRFLGHLQQFFDRQPLHARHRRHRSAAGKLVHEHRVDQVVGGQRVLAHEAARELAPRSGYCNR